MDAPQTSANARADAIATVRDLVLRFSCKDQPGIVATVASFFAEQGFNIRESSQYEDSDTGQFFMRTVFSACEGEHDLTEVRAGFKPLATQFAMDWQLNDYAYKPRIVIAVSQWGHCLEHLLNSWKRGTLPVEIVAVVSNHQLLSDLCAWYQVPFHYLPVDKETKAQQENQILQLMESLNADFLVLARYMQILSNTMCQRLKGRAINIHHSFLPGFKGARPYHQAHKRGVKLIGATAHYVTEDLDEGPIIEQEVERVNHANSPQEMVEIGRDVERVVLHRAVMWHASHRVLLNGDKTVVFSR